MSNQSLPIAVIGAGPVGLAAAAQIVTRGLVPLVFERGAVPAASLLEWSHVRVFSPWQYNLDAAARALLEQSGWTRPKRPTFRPAARSSVATFGRSRPCPRSRRTCGSARPSRP